MLSAILVMLAVTLVPTLRSMLSQQNEINDLRSHLGQKRETVAAMQREQIQWTDPAFIEQQARERLKFVRVGETSYTVIDSEAAPAARVTGPKIAAPVQASNASSPWYGQLWQSMVIADTPPKAAVKPAVKVPVGSKPSASPSAK
jgi:cell division protein FtsB